MARKCCKSDPPCKDCPKRKKKKHRIDDGCSFSAPDEQTIRTVFYCPLSDIAIKGQRG